MKFLSKFSLYMPSVTRKIMLKIPKPGIPLEWVFKSRIWQFTQAFPTCIFSPSSNLFKLFGSQISMSHISLEYDNDFQLSDFFLFFCCHPTVTIGKPLNYKEQKCSSLCDCCYASDQSAKIIRCNIAQSCMLRETGAVQLVSIALTLCGEM